jgi:hypothetical protein
MSSTLFLQFKGEQLMSQQPPQGYYPPVYYAPPQRKRSPWLIIVLLIGLALVLVAGYFLLFPTKHPPDGYMNTEDGSVAHVLRYLHWTEADGRLTGYWTIAEAKNDGKPTYDGGTLMGTHNGASISLTFYPNFGDGTNTGTLDNDILTLETSAQGGMVGTLVFRGVTYAQYQQELSDFKKIWG